MLTTQTEGTQGLSRSWRAGRLIWGLVAVLASGAIEEAHAQENSIFDSGGHLWVVGDVQAPAVADTFALLRVQRYPLLSLGVALTYDGPLVRNLELTVYVYPIPPDAADAVGTEFDSAVQEIHEYAQRRENMSVTVHRIEAFSLTVDGGLTLEGMFAEAEYALSGRTRRTLLYVFEKSGLILKYRMTHESSDPPELQGHLDEWLRLTAAQIRPYPR